MNIEAKRWTAHEVAARVAYVAKLPEVGSPLRAKADAIRAKAARVSELRAEALRLEQEAVDAASMLEEECKGLWSADEIAYAKECSGVVVSAKHRIFLHKVLNGVLVGGAYDDARVSRKLNRDGFIILVDAPSGGTFWSLTDRGRAALRAP